MWSLGKRTSNWFSPETECERRGLQKAEHASYPQWIFVDFIRPFLLLWRFSFLISPFILISNFEMAVFGCKFFAKYFWMKYQWTFNVCTFCKFFPFMNFNRYIYIYLPGITGKNCRVFLRPYCKNPKQQQETAIRNNNTSLFTKITKNECNTFNYALDGCDAGVILSKRLHKT